jgi:WD40 repeat protein
MLYSSSADHTIRSWATEFGECTRIFKDHGHSVPQFIIEDGLRNILKSKTTLLINEICKRKYLLVLSACGDGIARCYDAKSANLKRSMKNHKGCINGLRVSYKRIKKNPIRFK